MIESMLRKIVNYFINNPLQLLPLIVGSGGLIYWWDRLFKSHQKLAGRIISETSPMLGHVLLRFEIENRGKMQTSLNPMILVIGYSPKGVKQGFEFDLESKKIVGPQKRALPPFEPKTFSALAGNIENSYDFLLFRTYKFSAAQGRGLKIRVRSANLDKISFFRFYYEFNLFRLFKKNPFKRSEEE